MNRLFHLMLLALVGFLALGWAPVKAEDADDVAEVEEDDEVVSDEVFEEDEDFDEDFDEDEEAQVFGLRAAPDVETSVAFPNHEGMTMQAGKDVRTVITFANNGESVYNLSYVGANLHSPFDHTHFIMNFTVIAVNKLVQPGTEVTVEYSFRPDKSLEPIEFTLAGWAFYNSTADNMFRSHWVNDTITLTVSDFETSFQDMFTLIWLLGAFGFIGMLLLKDTKAGKKIEKQLEKKNAKAAKAAEADKPKTSGGWDDIHVYKQQPRSRRAKGSRK